MTSSAASGFRPRRALAYLGGFVGYGLGLSALYATTGIGLPCPFRMLTGWQCPFCGGTRLGRALLRGDLAAAFADNPVVFLGLAVLPVLGVLWTVEALGGPAVRLPARLRAAGRRLSPNRWLALGLVAATAFVVVRNLA